ncbi:MAG: HNH endonuclease [Chloroflexi bacterium]|nr:HNH endonuclease [Chloroflexota bacterium]
MRGYIAVTDPGWYEHLRSRPIVADVNFWKPSIRESPRLQVGTPFFFKLKAPHRAICGFGFVAGFSALPDWLAWEVFGSANGVFDFVGLQDRLARIRADARIEADPLGQIGCTLIAEASFFPQLEWVPEPSDWRPTTQTGAGYDLTRGEGRRIWEECLDRVRARQPHAIAEHGSATQGVTERDAGALERFLEPVARSGSSILVMPRLGQPIFRVRVLDAYGRACAVTAEHSLPVVEAAHIQPFASGGRHALANGIALRSDIHRLFDRGYVTIDHEYRFAVGSRLKADFLNGRSYYHLHGRPLNLPAQATARPAPDLLAWHRDRVFLG